MDFMMGSIAFVVGVVLTWLLLKDRTRSLPPDVRSLGTVGSLGGLEGYVVEQRTLESDERVSVSMEQLRSFVAEYRERKETINDLASRIAAQQTSLQAANARAVADDESRRQLSVRVGQLEAELAAAKRPTTDTVTKLIPQGTNSFVEQGSVVVEPTPLKAAAKVQRAPKVTKPKAKGKVSTRRART